jgi:flagellar basal body-associated protein FliL
MNHPQHFPIHPRFMKKQFAAAGSPPQQPEEFTKPVGGDVPFDDFDIFDAPPASADVKEEPQPCKKKPYDTMIIVMAVVIIVLIIVVVWLMLSNNSEPVSDAMVQPQFAGYPPGARMPPYIPQGPPVGLYQQQSGIASAASAPVQQAPIASTPVQQAPSPVATKTEMDALYEELKNKSAKNEKLPVDTYTLVDTRVESKEDLQSADKTPRLDTIFEEEDDAVKFTDQA